MNEDDNNRLIRVTSRRRFLIGAAVAVGTVSASGAVAASSSGSGAERRRAHRSSAQSDDAGSCQPTGFVQPVLTPSSGVAGSDFVVTGDVPVQEEDGTVVQPTSTDIWVWWNLDPNQWYTAQEANPVPAQEGQPVEQIGEAHFTTECSWSVTVQAPDVPPGDYDIVVLYSTPSGDGTSSFAPSTFSVAS